jgi:hypothetical protein
MGVDVGTSGVLVGAGVSIPTLRVGEQAGKRNSIPIKTAAGKTSLILHVILFINVSSFN